MKVLGNILPLFGRILLQIWQKRKKILFHLIFVYSSVNFCIWLQSYHYMKKHQAQLCRGPGVRQADWDPYICHIVHAKPWPQTTSFILQSDAVNACLRVQRGQGELVLDQDKLIKEEKLEQIKNYREKSKNSEAFTNICWMGERYYSFPLEELLESLQMTLLSKGKV